MKLDRVEELILNREGLAVNLDHFAMAGFSNEMTIILTGFAQILRWKRSQFEKYLQGSGGMSIENELSIDHWEDDCEIADGWCEPPFVGLRVVFYNTRGLVTPLARVKRFPDGTEEELIWAYLTSENADEVIKWLKYFEFPDEAIQVVRKAVSA